MFAEFWSPGNIQNHYSPFCLLAAEALKPLYSFIFVDFDGSAAAAAAADATAAATVVFIEFITKSEMCQKKRCCGVGSVHSSWNTLRPTFRL